PRSGADPADPGSPHLRDRASRRVRDVVAGHGGPSRGRRARGRLPPRGVPGAAVLGSPHGRPGALPADLARTALVPPAPHRMPPDRTIVRGLVARPSRLPTRGADGSLEPTWFPLPCPRTGSKRTPSRDDDRSSRSPARGVARDHRPSTIAGALAAPPDPRTRPRPGHPRPRGPGAARRHQAV